MRHQDAVGEPDAIRRRSRNREAPFPALLHMKRFVGGDAMGDLRHLRDGGDHPELGEKGRGSSLKGPESGGVDAIVVGQECDHQKLGYVFAGDGCRVYPCAVPEKQEILFCDRGSGKLCPESVYGEGPLRWAYETRLGRFCLENVVKRPWFSGLYGRWADSARSRKEVAAFVARFGVDTTEFLEPMESYRTFNEFFHRRLQPGARPIAQGEDVVVFPADGRHLLVPDLAVDSFIFAKGRRFPLDRFLGGGDLAKEFAGGSAIFSRLCPTDYHRFHFPLGGFCEDSHLIPGPLYSVSPIALGRSLGYLVENKRRLTRVRHAAIGSYLFIEVGATNVGSIVETCPGGVEVRKGDEKGYFRFGGSMVVTLFPAGAFQADPDLATQSAAGYELYAKVGESMGRIHRPG